MKLEGSTELKGSPEEVFDRMLDPAVLLRCVPGCERMEEIAPGEYETLVKAGVGPVKGSFEGKVTVSDVVRFSSYAMSVAGKSLVGHVQGGATVYLEAGAEGALVRYAGEAKVSGRLASVGSRLIDVAARKVAREFFERLAAEVDAATEEG